MTETREDDAKGRGGKKREQGGRSFREDSHAHHYFNIRPHVGDDGKSRQPAPGYRNFNPRPHVGDDAEKQMPSIITIFQSTSPRGGRLSRVVIMSCRSISIHVPTWGTTDGYMTDAGGYRLISIHVPTWGTTCR